MIYNVVLISVVQQSDPVTHTRAQTHTYIHILFYITFHYGLSQDIEYVLRLQNCCSKNVQFGSLT